MCDRYRDGKCISRYCHYLSAGGTCLNPKMKPNLTNADRIRGMSDEELAEMLTGDREWLCEIMCGKVTICGGNCKENALNWLQQPAETEGTE